MKQSEERSSGGGYGYYGGYYYGEGYGGGYADAATSPTRGIKDYLLMLRERIWWLVTTVFVVFLGVALYTFNAPQIFLAQSSVQILRSADDVTQYEGVTDNEVIRPEDLQTQIDILESIQIIMRVDERIQGDLRDRLMKPYQTGLDVSLRGEKTVPGVLFDGRSIQPERMSMVVRIAFEHPDPQVAAEVANLFVQQYIEFNRNQQVDGSMSAREDLRQQVEEQASKVRELELKLADFKDRYGTVSMEGRQDVDSQELLQLKTVTTEAKRKFDLAQSLYDQIQETREAGVPLYELSFISEDPRVSNLLSVLSSTQIEIAALSKKYGPKHPRMIAVQESATQTRQELEQAIRTRATSIENDYLRARTDYNVAERRLAEKQQEMIELERIRPEYNALMRDLEVSRSLYDHLQSRMQQTTTMVAVTKSNARLIDRATPPPRAYKPNIAINLGVGLVMGLGLGFGLVFLLAILDDKVKTAFDVESTIGIPLIGIVPRISIVDPLEKARVVASNLDRHTVEAFRAIHSTLKLNEESRNAKVIITTSTIPSEGKSFISTNLAFTFANHGEKTLVIDADLRMPNVGKSLDIANRKGLIQVLSQDSISLDEAIQKDIVPGMDILVTGGRSKNPTQLLSSERFEEMLHELRNRYDKIIIDTPPLAPVSDALNILPLADGVVYVIRFNLVKRKTAAMNIRRIRESNVPILGAVMNNINTQVAGYYYSHYYDNSYRNYYVSAAAEVDTEETKNG